MEFVKRILTIVFWPIIWTLNKWLVNEAAKQVAYNNKQVNKKYN